MTDTPKDPVTPTIIPRHPTPLPPVTPTALPNPSGPTPSSPNKGPNIPLVTPRK